MTAELAESPRPTAKPEAVDRLFDMSDEEFADVVSDDVRNCLDDEDLRIALRDDEVLDDWHEALVRLIMDIDAQMAGKKGLKDAVTRAWRVGANRVKAGAVARKRECHALRAERNRRDHPPSMEKNRELGTARPKHRIAIPGREGVENTSEARAEAGQRAVKRLMDAHPEEWLDLLAQEYGKAGLPVKAHWIRGIDA